MWVVAVLGAAPGPPGCPRKLRQRVDGVGAMRVCCCDAAFDGGLRFVREFALCKALGFRKTRHSARERQGHNERPIQGYVDVPWSRRQATARAGWSLFFPQRPRRAIGFRAAKGSQRPRARVATGAEAALARPHAKKNRGKPSLCSTPTGELGSRQQHRSELASRSLNTAEFQKWPPRRSLPSRNRASSIH